MKKLTIITAIMLLVSFSANAKDCKPLKLKMEEARTSNNRGLYTEAKRLFRACHSMNIADSRGKGRSLNQYMDIHAGNDEQETK